MQVTQVFSLKPCLESDKPHFCMRKEVTNSGCCGLGGAAPKEDIVSYDGVQYIQYGASILLYMHRYIIFIMCYTIYICTGYIIW